MSRFEIEEEMRTLAGKIKLLDNLRKLNDASVKMGKDAHYYVVILDSEKKQTVIKSFRRDQLKEALEIYKLEEAVAGSVAVRKADVVWVSAGDLKQLKRAYPNYFLDVKDFISIVEDLISKKGV